MNAGGLFANLTRSHRGPGRQAIAKRRQRSDFNREKLDAFAEALAEHGTVTAAAKTIGVTQQRGSILLARIKAELGEQADG